MVVGDDTFWDDGWLDEFGSSGDSVDAGSEDRDCDWDSVRWSSVCWLGDEGLFTGSMVLWAGIG